MVCLMVEEFETVNGGKRPSLRKNGLFWDYIKVGKHIATLTSAPGKDFAPWQAEVGKYRDFIHKTAHAVAINSKQQWLLLKPELVDQVRDWTEVNQRPPADFLDLQTQMDGHFQRLLMIGSEVWKYFIAEVGKWKSHPQGYKKLLSLP